MKYVKTLLLVLLCSTFGVIGGAAAGYYAAMTTPAVSNIAVLDVDTLSKSMDPSSPDYQKKAQEVADRVKEMTARLTAAGVVVLDRSVVLSAPEEAVIRVELDK